MQCRMFDLSSSMPTSELVLEASPVQPRKEAFRKGLARQLKLCRLILIINTCTDQFRPLKQVLWSPQRQQS